MKIYPRSKSLDCPENDFLKIDEIGRIIPNINEDRTCYIFGQDPICLFVFRDKNESIIKCILRIQTLLNRSEGIYDDYYCSFNLIDKKTGEFINDLDLIFNEFMIVTSKLNSIGYIPVFDEYANKVYMEASYYGPFQFKQILDSKYFAKWKYSKKFKNIAYVPYLFGDRAYYFTMTGYSKNITIASLNDCNKEKDFYLNYGVFRNNNLLSESFEGLSKMFCALTNKEREIFLLKNKSKE